MAEWTKTWTWMDDGAWIEGNQPVLGPRSHAFWLGSSVFDGARAFEGVMPDLDLHMARVNRSAEAIGLRPTLEWQKMVEITEEGVRKFPPGTPLYIRPLYWAESSDVTTVCADPETTRFVLSLWEAPIPRPHGAALTVSPFRKPTIETAPTDAKAGCLYPNNARALREARSRGFDNSLMLDTLGNVAETATANVFLVKEGTVATPVPNGTFLNGITRQRVIRLLRAANVRVEEVSLTARDFLTADEVFTTGNYSKVTPVTRVDDREFQPGPFYQLARKAYWDFAHA